MIPFEDLCAALDAYAARTRGMQPSSAPPTSSRTAEAGGAQVIESTVTESMLDDSLPSVEPQAVLRSHTGEGGEEGTMMDGLQPVYEDKSNELDIGDVLSDEEDPN